MVPKIIGIAGDSAAGKSTLARGLQAALGDRSVMFCTDNYHRLDRSERVAHNLTALNPDANYIDIMEQHLHLLALGHAVLAPHYEHRTGRITRPELVESREFVIVEGLLPLHTKRARTCFDIKVYVELPEVVRHAWKLKRDTATRGYTPEEVRTELDRREQDSVRFIQSQKRYADVVLTYEAVREPWHADDPLSATLVLRPTIDYPNMAAVLNDDPLMAVNIRLTRDADARTPTDVISINGWTPEVVTRRVQDDICTAMGLDGGGLHSGLGVTKEGVRSEPLALTQLLLLSLLLQSE